MSMFGGPGPSNSGNMTPYRSPMGEVNLAPGATWRDYYTYMQKIHTQQGAGLGAAMDAAFMQNNKSIDEAIVPTIGGSYASGKNEGTLFGGGGQAAAAGLGFAAANADNGNKDSEAAYSQWLAMQQRQKAEQARLQQIAQQNSQMMQQPQAAPDAGIMQQAAMLQFQASQMLQPPANPGLRKHTMNTGGPSNSGRSMLLGG